MSRQGPLPGSGEPGTRAHRAKRVPRLSLRARPQLPSRCPAAGYHEVNAQRKTVHRKLHRGSHSWDPRCAKIRLCTRNPTFACSLSALAQWAIFFTRCPRSRRCASLIPTGKSAGSSSRAGSRSSKHGPRDRRNKGSGRQGLCNAGPRLRDARRRPLALRPQSRMEAPSVERRHTL